MVPDCSHCLCYGLYDRANAAAFVSYWVLWSLNLRTQYSWYCKIPQQFQLFSCQLCSYNDKAAVNLAWLQSSMRELQTLEYFKFNLVFFKMQNVAVQLAFVFDFTRLMKWYVHESIETTTRIPIHKLMIPSCWLRL